MVNMGQVPNPMESPLLLECQVIHLVCQVSHDQEVLLDPQVLVDPTDCQWAIPTKTEYRQVFPVLSHPGHHCLEWIHDCPESCHLMACQVASPAENQPTPFTSELTTNYSLFRSRWML